MVDKFRTILESIEETRGLVSLFALLKMDELVDKWTVVLSAPWTVPEDRDVIFEQVRKLIIDTLAKDELSEVSRLAIYPKTEHLIEELLKYQSGTILKDQKVNGNMVHYAEIIKSDATVL